MAQVPKELIDDGCVFSEVKISSVNSPSPLGCHTRLESGFALTGIYVRNHPEGTRDSWGNFIWTEKFKKEYPKKFKEDHLPKLLKLAIDEYTSLRSGCSHLIVSDNVGRYNNPHGFDSLWLTTCMGDTAGIVELLVRIGGWACCATPLASNRGYESGVNQHFVQTFVLTPPQGIYTLTCEGGGNFNYPAHKARDQIARWASSASKRICPTYMARWLKTPYDHVFKHFTTVEEPTPEPKVEPSKPPVKKAIKRKTGFYHYVKVSENGIDF